MLSNVLDPGASFQFLGKKDAFFKKSEEFGIFCFKVEIIKRTSKGIEDNFRHCYGCSG